MVLVCIWSGSRESLPTVGQHDKSAPANTHWEQLTGGREARPQGGSPVDVVNLGTLLFPIENAALWYPIAWWL